MKEKMEKIFGAVKGFMIRTAQMIQYFVLLFAIGIMNIIDSKFDGMDRFCVYSIMMMEAIDHEYNVQCLVALDCDESEYPCWTEYSQGEQGNVIINPGKCSLELFENVMYAFCTSGTRSQTVPGVIDISRIVCADGGRKYRAMKKVILLQDQLSGVFETMKGVMSRCKSFRTVQQCPIA